MNRIEQILQNEKFIKIMSDIEKYETDRKFCLHGIDHGIDVARICYILALEEKLDIDKEVIYAMALLHDIGRVSEYEKGISHHEQGADMAGRLLREAGFDENDVKAICKAIEGHKHISEEGGELATLLFKADKLSRKCFACNMYEECYWKDELKNKTIIV